MPARVAIVAALTVLLHIPVAGSEQTGGIEIVRRPLKPSIWAASAAVP